MMAIDALKSVQCQPQMMFTIENDLYFKRIVLSYNNCNKEQKGAANERNS